MTSIQGQTRLQRWESRGEIPLLLLALAFLVAYAWPVLNPSLDRSVATALDTVSWTVWVAFGVDFSCRLALANNRRTYALKHWYDVAMIVLPVLRPLRLLRLLTLGRLLNRGLAGSLPGRVTTYVVGTAVAAVGLGALAILDAEQEATGANIVTFGDALWWAATTVTTVGYGDHYPVTTAGRLVAVTLMLLGIALVGSVTAGVAAWFISASQTEGETRRNEAADQ